jgi:hypothetical protein
MSERYRNQIVSVSEQVSGDLPFGTEVALRIRQ